MLVVGDLEPGLTTHMGIFCGGHTLHFCHYHHNHVSEVVGNWERVVGEKNCDFYL
jgi:hypothetical protein